MRYDNLADARSKLVGTMIYFEKKALFCKDVRLREGTTDVFTCLLVDVSDSGARSKSILLTDPGLRYMEFNIGYINAYNYATWFYRQPYKQYRQGLRLDQVEHRDESGLFRYPGVNQAGILGANRYTAQMMENNYPSIEEARDQLASGEVTKVAFHVDFAMFKDKLRGDHVLEHRGVPMAFADLNLVFRCSPEYKFLRESMQEINLKVA